MDLNKPKKKKISQKNYSFHTSMSEEDEIWSSEKKPKRLCSKTRRKTATKQMKLDPPPIPSFPNAHCLPFHFLFACSIISFPLILLPHPHSLRSFCHSRSVPHEPPGRDRETVVVLAVWHYQLINPRQQLGCLLSSLPSAAQEVEEPSDLPGGALTGTLRHRSSKIKKETHNICYVHTLHM